MRLYFVQEDFRPSFRQKTTAEEQGENSSVSQEKPEESAKLMDKTGYASMLDRHDLEWRKANQAIMKSYMEKFRQWMTEMD